MAENSNKEATKGRGLETIDKTVLAIAGIVCVVIIALTLGFPTQAESLIQGMNSAIIANFAWFYNVTLVACMVFVYYVAFSRYGKVRLGGNDEKPLHKFGTWFFMLFTAGMGVGLLFYSVAEPMSVFIAPPTGDGDTIQSAQLALRQSFMHWGITPWVGYAAIGGALAYSSHRLKKPAVISSVYVPLVGEKATKGVFGRIIDSLAVIVAVFGVTTSLGLGAMQVAGGLEYQFGIPATTTIEVVIIVGCTIIFVVGSLIGGIDKAISFCSTLNIWVMIALTAIIFIIGNTPFLLNYFTESFGGYISNFITQSFSADTFNETNGWVGAWTIFFWAWWIAWIPFTGGFIAKISKGRSLREFILGVTLCPCLFSFVFMTVFGGSAIDLTLNGGVTAIQDALTQNTALGLFATLQQFPFAVVTIVLILILLLIFFVAHLQVGSVVICEMLSKPGTEAPIAIKLFWGCVLGAIAAALLLAGGLSSIQTISIIGALPFGVVVIGGLFAFKKALSLEFKEDGTQRTQDEMIELYATTDFTPKFGKNKEEKKAEATA
ncbi:MAG: BCCT family transporter [Phoenicibacter congonensis]|uniref:BCCT family transporter n=1 Tax=Phoenicibacter congonensis TaxID=1944646 RepID=A0AA43RIQ6_9ACTN|nr:BCCT family transporter [Phoenicibacter congonensis]